jgi:translation initiation factor IF-3
LYNNSGA